VPNTQNRSVPENLSGNTNDFWTACRNVHSDLMNQVMKVGGSGRELTLATNLDQNSDLAAGMNVARRL
jgi:hypothetical protein